MVKNPQNGHVRKILVQSASHRPVRKIDTAVDKLEGTGAPCITEHEGFKAVYLNMCMGVTNCILPV